MERLDMTLAEAGFCDKPLLYFPYGRMFSRSIYFAKGFCEVHFLHFSVVFMLLAMAGRFIFHTVNNYLYLYCHDWFR